MNDEESIARVNAWLASLSEEEQIKFTERLWMAVDEPKKEDEDGRSERGTSEPEVPGDD